MTVLNKSGDKGSPRDDVPGRRAAENDPGRFGMVEFCVHADEIVCEKRRRRRIECFDDSGVHDATQTHGTRGDCILEE